MNLPTVLATNYGSSAGDVNQTAITLPAGVTAGDGLLLIFTKDGSAPPSYSFGAVWTGIISTSTAAHWAGVYWRVATGSDSITIVHPPETTAYTVYRIGGHDASITPVVATPVTGSNAFPDPPNLDPSSWNSDDALWIAAYAWDGRVAHTTYPYSSNQLTSRYDSLDAVGVASSTRESAASSENPGLGTLASSTPWIAFTIAVRGYGIFDTGIFDIFTFDTLADAITGTMAPTDGADTSAITGKIDVSGTMSATGGTADVSAISGGPVVSGTMSPQETGPDIFAADGYVAFVGAIGYMAALESGPDVHAASGTVAVAGSMDAQSTGSDTSTMTGGAVATGALLVQEASTPDTFAGAGQLIVLGSVWTVETGSDTSTGAGGVAVAGTGAAVETGSDTFTATGLIGYTGISGGLDAQEASPDAMEAAGTIALGGALLATEAGPDVLTVVASLPVAGSFAVQETGTDTITVAGASVPVAGTLAVTEASGDTAAFYGVVNYVGVSGVLDGEEAGSDTFAAAGTVVWGDRTGTMAAVETGLDAATGTGSLGWWGPTVLYVIYPSAMSPPSAAQIRQGLNSAGAPATAAGWMADPQTGGEMTFPAATGLSPMTSYRVSFVWSDGVDDSAVVTSDPFTTLLEVTGVMVAQESGDDPTVIFGQVAVRGSITAQELFGDVMYARERAEGVMNAVELMADISSILGGIEVRGSGSAIETGNDLAEMLAGAYATAVLDAIEAGADTFEGTATREIAGALDAVEGNEDTFVGFATQRDFESVVQMIVSATPNEADPAEKEEVAVVFAQATRQKFISVPATSRRISVS